MANEQLKINGRTLLAVVALVVIGLTGWNIYKQTQNWRTLQSQSVRHAPPAFDFTGSSIPVKEIHPGGPPKDGIPALTNPKFVADDAADYLQPNDSVIGVSIAGDVRAYPLKILDRHEIVNDTIGDTPIAVTYCPLCDSSVVFDRQIGGETRELGVSGLLYNSNVLMYDRKAETESLISQMKFTGVSGPLNGAELRRMPLEVTTWQAWRERHPETRVLSPDTGHKRDYTSRAYKSYFESPKLRFPVSPLDERLPAKTPVLGIAVGGERRAYPVEKVIALDSSLDRQSLGSKEFNLVADADAQSVRVEQPDDEVEWTYSYWFAWSAMHPETELWGEDE